MKADNQPNQTENSENEFVLVIKDNKGNIIVVDAKTDNSVLDKFGKITRKIKIPSADNQFKEDDVPKDVLDHLYNANYKEDNFANQRTGPTIENEEANNENYSPTFDDNKIKANQPIQIVNPFLDELNRVQEQNPNQEEELDIIILRDDL